MNNVEKKEKAKTVVHSKITRLVSHKRVQTAEGKRRAQLAEIKVSKKKAA